MTDIVPRLRRWWEPYGGGMSGAEANADDLIQEAADEIERLRAERDRLREALRDLLDLCSHADFKNGVTDATGTMDEGEHWASVFIDRARTALGKDRA